MCDRPLFPALFCVVMFALLATHDAVGEAPSVIVIMADDVGYGDVSCYGAEAFETPRIDRLAAEGVRFTSGYCSASTCTPTRYSLLTGEYAFRRPGTGIAPPNSPALVQPDRVTLPGVLRGAGYRTAVIGKWHLGLGAPGKGPDWNGEIKPGPLEIGFDHCFLLPTTNDRVPQVYVEDHRVLNLDPADPLWVGDKKPEGDHPTGNSHRGELRMDWTHGHNATIHNGISRIGFYTGGHAARFRDEDLADAWVERSVAWIKERVKKGERFFLFFSSHDNHVPRMPHERFQGVTSLGYRADSIVQLDWCVGALVDALDDLGIAEDTLVIFTSDNGPVMDDGYADGALEKLGDHRAAGPFRGGKYSVYEGGTRVPFIARWPERIAAGQVSDEIICTIDLATSLNVLAGAEIPEDAFPDSFDLSGLLAGEEGAKGRDHLVQQDNGQGGNYGYRSGHWKLLRHDSGRTRNLVVERLLTNTEVPRLQLFDLAEDPGEKKDLAKERPEVLARMAEELEGIIAAGRSRP